MNTHWYIIEFDYLLSEIKSIKEEIEYNDYSDREAVYVTHKRITELVERYNKPIEHAIPPGGKLTKKTKK